MSYLALARKWRPRTFSQLVGQEHINKALIKSLNQQRLHHAYLFTGTRGVGKTSVARLMAKALNCEQGVSAEPCLTCDACIAIEQGRFIDLIEIDGASKTRVEDTRELMDNVQYAPTNGRYKIYLIDEVHMLSQHSFNALLKTLEEPPQHVKFLLATTDPQKLPVTVLSRCLQFNLKHLSIDVIASHLKLILNQEQHDFEEEALALLAKAAHGSMRDALSLLDQAIASSDNTLRTQEVKSILGLTQQDYALKLLQALTTQDAVQLITLSRQIANEGGHFNYVLDELLEYLHKITVSQNLADTNYLQDFSDEIKWLAKHLKAEDVQLFYQIGIKGCEEMHLAPTLAIGFEMTLFRMLTFRPACKVSPPPLAYEVMPTNQTVKDSPLVHNEVLPINTLEALALKIDIYPSAPAYDTELPVKYEPNKERQETLSTEQPFKSLPATAKQTPNSSSTLPAEPSILENSPPKEPGNLNWSAILGKIKLSGLAQNAAENAEMLSKQGREIVLAVEKGHQSLFTNNVIQRIEQALSLYFGEAIKINLNFNEPVNSTPAQKKHIAQTLNQKEAESSLLHDPALEQIKREFSAEMVKNSIELLQDLL